MVSQARVVRDGFLEEKTRLQRGPLSTASERQNHAMGPWESSRSPLSLSFLICIRGTRTLGGRWGESDKELGAGRVAL